MAVVKKLVVAEYAGADQVECVEGLAAVSENVNIVGLWAWVRGGGWGGPFVPNENWIDANVYAVPRLADDANVSVELLVEGWVKDRLKVCDDRVCEAMKRVLVGSSERILKGFYIGAYSAGRDVPWHPSADWIQDDLLDADAAWRIVQRLPLEDLAGVVREKQEAVDLIFGDRVALQGVVDDGNRKVIEPLVSTLIYTESFFAVLRDLLAGLIAYRGYLKNKDAGLAEQCCRKLRFSQDHWHQHTQHHGALIGTATPFRERNFWVLTQRIIDELS